MTGRLWAEAPRAVRQQMRVLRQWKSRLMPIADLCEKGHNGFTGLFFADEPSSADTSPGKVGDVKTSFRPEERPHYRR